MIAKIMLDMARADIDQDTLSRLVRNAMLLHAQDDQDRAQIALDFVAANSIRVLGEDHPDTLGALLLLADFMRARGKLQPAPEIEEPAFKAWCERALWTTETH